MENDKKIITSNAPCSLVIGGLYIALLLFGRMISILNSELN